MGNSALWLGLAVMVVVMGAVAYTDTYYDGSFGQQFVEKSSKGACFASEDGTCPSGYFLCDYSNQTMTCCRNLLLCG